jgi:hypothetical protein
MTDQELLDASRLFWRFQPDSRKWEGIGYALVAHAGTVRAVLRITKIIGPLWGRYGFQGYIVKDPKIASELTGRVVPVRQNPATTIELLASGNGRSRPVRTNPTWTKFASNAQCLAVTRGCLSLQQRTCALP